MIYNFIPFFISSILSLLLVPLVRKICILKGKVVLPREDRWHQKATATLGGIAIFLSFFLTLLAFLFINNKTAWHNFGVNSIIWELLLCCLLMFFLGLYDDIKELTPPIKLLGQVIIATIVILFGFKTEFFSPRVDNRYIAEILNIILTYIWIIGITNAFNLIDNIDGLSSGIAFIASLFLAYFFWKNQNPTLMGITLALSGSILGFLIFNFPPAKIFMGDSGSLFIGFILALLAIIREPQASNVFAVMAVPLLLFMLPIFDTFLVMFSRLLSGKSPMKGGKDHTSHRLVAFGFTERRAVILLYGVGLISGILAATLESIRYWYSLVLVPIIVISLSIVTAYLGGIKVVESPEIDKKKTKFSKMMMEFTYRRRILEVIFDFFLIGLSYYIGFLIRYSFQMNEIRYEIFISTLPIALAGIYVAFFVFGVYKAVWLFLGIRDLVKYLQASLVGVLIVAFILLTMNQGKTFNLLFFFIFWLVLSLGLVISRSSFHMMNQLAKNKINKVVSRVIIIGAEEEGELAAYWTQSNPEISYKIVGFLDENPLLVGKSIHGIPVMGDYSQLEKIIIDQKISGLIITKKIENNLAIIENLLSICRLHNCWIKISSFELNDLL